MPELYETLKGKWRTPQQGADTLVWLAISRSASKHASGLFFQGILQNKSILISYPLQYFINLALCPMATVPVKRWVL